MPADLTRSTTPPEGFSRLESTERFRGKLVTVRSDRLRTGRGHETTYDVVEHAPAVAVVALDEEGRVLLVRQWRHPVGAAEWELPAGIVDDGDASAQAAAERELAEETGVRAERWEHLLTQHSSPGVLTERCEVFVATGTRAVAAPDREEAEADSGMRTTWVPVADAVAAVRAGDITNALAVAGLLAVGGPLR